MAKTKKKYELLANDPIVGEFGQTLYRIRALCNFGAVKKGDLGGYIRAEVNLSHNGNAWVEGEASVYGSATVLDDAFIGEHARVYGRAVVSGRARVEGFAQVYGNASVCRRSQIRGEAHIYGDASVDDDSIVSRDSHVCGDARIEDNARIRGARVFGRAVIGGKATLLVDTKVCGATRVYGNATIRRWDSYTPVLSSNADWMMFTNVGSENGVLTVYTAYRADTCVLMCTRGCFTGTDSEFMEAVRLEHGTSLIAQEYELMIQVAKLRLAQDRSGPALQNLPKLAPAEEAALDEGDGESK